MAKKEKKRKRPKGRSLEQMLEESDSVLFDMDLTLIDWTPAAERAYNRILNKRGLNGVSAKRIKKELAEIGFRNSLKELGVEDIDQAMNEYYHEVTRNLDHIKVYEGVPELIYALKQAGKKVSIVSNNSNFLGPRFLQRVVDAYNSRYHRNESRYSLFDHIGWSDDYRSDKKPSPIPLERAIQRTMSAPERTLVVGDSYQDIVAANRAGIGSIGLLNQYTDAKDFRESPDLVIRDTKELSAKVNKYFSEYRLAA